MSCVGQGGKMFDIKAVHNPTARALPNGAIAISGEGWGVVLRADGNGNCVLNSIACEAYGAVYDNPLHPGEGLVLSVPSAVMNMTPNKTEYFPFSTQHGSMFGPFDNVRPRSARQVYRQGTRPNERRLEVHFVPYGENDLPHGVHSFAVDRTTNAADLLAIFGGSRRHEHSAFLPRCAAAGVSELALRGRTDCRLREIAVMKPDKIAPAKRYTLT